MIMKLPEVRRKVKNALDKLYEKDNFLFIEGLHEMCINFRFAVYLEQENFGDDYFVDCEYDKSHSGNETSQKDLTKKHGNRIDTVVTKRSGDGNDDLVCFEVKKWDSKDNGNDDRAKLKVLIGQNKSVRGREFGYDYGFFIEFGETKEKTKIEIYQKGEETEKIVYQDL